MTGKAQVVLDRLPEQVNIDGSRDPFYRYRMPQLVLHHTTDFTVFTNLDAVAKALNNAPVPKLMAHFVRALCTSRGKANSVRGRHTCGIVARALCAYIVTHVLCPACGLPEVYGKACRACGHTQ